MSSVTWSSGSPRSSPAGGVELTPGPSVDDDPVGAWRVHADGVQALLDAPDADRPFTHPRAGAHPLDQAIDMFYTSDVFMHTWDLARATGQDDRLDADLCAQLLEGMTQMEDAHPQLRAVRPRRPGARGRPGAGPDDRLHRPRPVLEARRLD